LIRRSFNIVGVAVICFLVGGCLAVPIQECAEGKITLIKTKPDSFERMRGALEQFARKYDYTLRGRLFEGHGYKTAAYEARTGFLGSSHAPNAKDRPLVVSVTSRPDGSITIYYEDGYGAERTNNPVVAELKQFVLRHTKGEPITYSREPAHWHIATIGGN
jgi:hypothetical protein